MIVKKRRYATAVQTVPSTAIDANVFQPGRSLGACATPAGGTAIAATTDVPSAIACGRAVDRCRRVSRPPAA
jgi:hypothetical protein